MDNNTDNNTEVSRYEMLASFLTDDALNNVTLKGTDGVAVRANRFLLAAQSQVFRGMLVGKFQESSSLVVALGFQGSVLKAVVEFILTDSAELLADSKKKRKHQDIDEHGKDTNTTVHRDFQAIQLLVSFSEAASYFGLPGLKKLVIEHLKETLKECPSLSFSLLQACRVEGLAAPPGLVEFAMASVQNLPGKYITSKAVACLSTDVLEEILKDPDTGMTEYQLFLVLMCWTEANSNSDSNQEDTQNIAKSLSKHISLEKINTSHLSTTIEPSGLVTTEQLWNAYKQHALTTNRQVETPRQKKFTTELPDDHGPPSEILVQGAGVDAVNGVYAIDGFQREFPKYTMQGTYHGNSCMFEIYTCGVAWYICIPGADIDARDFFYQVYVQNENKEFPPHTGWEAVDEGIGTTAPAVSFRIGPLHIFRVEE